MSIINSFLDLDFYKLTMGQLVWKKYPKVQVKYAFKNRTKDVKLEKIIDESDLRRELDHIGHRNVSNLERQEEDYLSGLGIFTPGYISFLKYLDMPKYSLAFTSDGDLDLTFEGPWSTAIYWETFALSIISELYSRASCPDVFILNSSTVTEMLGMRNLQDKIRKLSAYPDIRISDFGTRRRFDRSWQEFVVRKLKDEIPNQFLGTSNVDLARRYNLKPIGTMAHELFMVRAGIENSYHANIPVFCENRIRVSPAFVIRDWVNTYGMGLTIALTDTFGTDFFLSSKYTVHSGVRNGLLKWHGLRQDSGDPIEFGEKAIKFYEAHEINPKKKLIVFSDGLDIDKIIEIHEHFKGRIQTSFGWGTNLTNDLGLKPLSLVIKAVEANGQGLVKLSDNLAKAIGTPEDIERYKKIFGYTGNNYQEANY